MIQIPKRDFSILIKAVALIALFTATMATIGVVVGTKEENPIMVGASTGVFVAMVALLLIVYGQTAGAHEVTSEPIASTRR